MFGPETLATTYGLASALAWGASDFAGGYVSRKVEVLGVVFRSQVFGGVFLLILALSFSNEIPPLRHFLISGLAGTFGVLGLVAFYMALARGRMSIVAPVSALVTTIIPVLFSIFREGLPGPVRLLGFGFAMLAILFLTQNRTGKGFSREETILPALAGTGFGFFFICIDLATTHSVLWPLVGARAVSVSLVGGFLLLSRNREATSTAQLPMVLLAGVFDALGNLFFALAANLGRLDVSAVLASLYPAATVMLAWIILKERLNRLQWAGVLAALVGLFLISL